MDATLPDGSRLHVVIPDITRTHWQVTLRTFVVKANRIEDLVRLGTLARRSATLLDARRERAQRPRRRWHAGR